jgi:HEPN domain-containing protein
MKASMQEEGRKLIRASEDILRRDAETALAAGDFNLVVRRSQEVVELALKGALRILGVDYPRVHDVAPVFSEQVQRKRGMVDLALLEQIEGISLWLGQARAPSFYFERDYDEEDARKALEDAGFVLTQVKKILGNTG